MSQTVTRPTPGAVEERHAPAIEAEGKRLRGRIPYGVESRDLGGWREVIEPGALRGAKLDDLIATVDHVGVPIGRHPGTLEVEDRADALHWSVALPESRADVREAVERGDLRAGSWRMVVKRDRWDGDVRHVEEIAELRDVAVVTNPAYPAAAAELRSAPETDEPTSEISDTETSATEDTDAADERQEDTIMQVEDRTEGGTGGLAVEDRAADQPSVEARVMDALRSIQKGEARSLTTASAAALAPAEVGTFVFDRLRAASVALASGIRIIPTDRASITWPQITADVSPAWYTEGETITAGDPTLATLRAEPKKLAHLIVTSNEVLDDSEPSAQEVLRDHLLKMLAFKLDGEIFAGNDGDGITGFANVSGRQQIRSSTNGDALRNYDLLVRAVGMLQAANVPGPYVAAMNPRTATELSMLKTGISGDATQLAKPPEVPPIVTTSQISTAVDQGTARNSTSIFVYAPAQIVLVRRQDATVELDRSRRFNSDESELRGKTRVDLLVPDPNAIVQISGIIPPA